MSGPGAQPPYYPVASTKHDNTRRELEDAAALGFSKLPDARRAELLAAPPPRVKKAAKKKPAKQTSAKKLAKLKPTKEKPAAKKKTPPKPRKKK